MKHQIQRHRSDETRIILRSKVCPKALWALTSWRWRSKRQLKRSPAHCSRMQRMAFDHSFLMFGPDEAVTAGPKIINEPVHTHVARFFKTNSTTDRLSKMWLTLQFQDILIFGQAVIVWRWSREEVGKMDGNTARTDEVASARVVWPRTIIFSGSKLVSDTNWSQ